MNNRAKITHNRIYSRNFDDNSTKILSMKYDLFTNPFFFVYNSIKAQGVKCVQ